MGRRRVKHELIPNESVRKVTFRKRKAGLLKKLSELATLCGVVACAIVYSAYDSQPAVWPSPAETFHVLNRFKNLPMSKQGRYMMDQKVFLRRNISMLNEKLEKETKKNRELERELILARCLASKDLHGLTHFGNLKGLSHFLKERISLIAGRVEYLKNFKSTLVTVKNDENEN